MINYITSNQREREREERNESFFRREGKVRKGEEESESEGVKEERGENVIIHQNN